MAWAFLRILPGAGGACAFCTAQAGLLAAQGLGIIVAGAAARLGPQAAVGIAGLFGMTAAAALASDWVRQRGALTGGPGGQAPAVVVRRRGG